MLLTMFIQTHTLFRQNHRSPFEFFHSFLLKVKILYVLKSDFKNYGRSTFLQIHLLLYISISEDFFLPVFTLLFYGHYSKLPLSGILEV